MPRTMVLLDEFVSLRQVFPLQLILFSQPDQFFFDRYARTLLGLTPFGKSPANLGSYDCHTYLAELNLLCPRFTVLLLALPLVASRF